FDAFFEKCLGNVAVLETLQGTVGTKEVSIAGTLSNGSLIWANNEKLILFLTPVDETAYPWRFSDPYVGVLKYSDQLYQAIKRVRAEQLAAADRPPGGR